MTWRMADSSALIEGMLGSGWRKDVFDFYTFEGAKALRDKLRYWEGGKLVVHISEMPIKCPVAPLEFSFLADSYLRERGLRHKTEIVYVTPLSGAFTKPIASKALGHLLEDRQINVVGEFNASEVDNERSAWSRPSTMASYSAKPKASYRRAVAALRSPAAAAAAPAQPHPRSHVSA